MTLNARTLASGPGWCVRDVVCTAGPGDRSFEERHDTVSLAAVMTGTFQYRTAQGSALMVPGAVLLGNHGSCFECGHDHGTGDRCLSFHYAPEYWEDVGAALPGARRVTFRAPRVAPGLSLLSVTAALTATRDSGWEIAEETALEFAAAVLSAEAGFQAAPDRLGPRDERRVSEAVRRIEETAHICEDGALSVGRLAREAGTSPYHFLRIFRRLVGMTPHQYVLRTRMYVATTRLRLSNAPVSTIAFEAGFNDLSTFNRRFRKLMGVPPTAYRSSSRAIALNPAPAAVSAPTPTAARRSR